MQERAPERRAPNLHRLMQTLHHAERDREEIRWRGKGSGLRRKTARVVAHLFGRLTHKSKTQEGVVR